MANSSDDQNQGFFNFSNLVKDYTPKEKNKYISTEHQEFGMRLAFELSDLDHKSLYIRLAKLEKRSHIETALSFVVDSNARSKAKLFMWKLKQLKDKNLSAPIVEKA